MLGSRLLRMDDSARHGRVHKGLEAGFDAMARAYDRSLLLVLRHRFVTLLVSFALLGGTVWLLRTMPTGFIPSQDSGFFFAFTMGAQDFSFESMAAHEYAVSESARHDPNVSNTGAFLKGGNQAAFFVKLKPREERSLSVDQLIAELRGKFMQVPGILSFPQNPPPITVSGQYSNSVYQLTLQSTSLKDLYAWTPRVMQAMTTLPGFVDVNSEPGGRESATDGEHRSRSCAVAWRCPAADPGRAHEFFWKPSGVAHL
jgi:HAE1 family hydrophobic/amphiphilic exporter-1